MTTRKNPSGEGFTLRCGPIRNKGKYAKFDCEERVEDREVPLGVCSWHECPEGFWNVYPNLWLLPYYDEIASLLSLV